MNDKALYEQELQALKPHDPIQFSEEVRGFQFIVTAGHGYLVVPKEEDGYPCLASSVMAQLGDFGFVGANAFYLEEDCEAQEFLRRVAEMQG